MCSVIQGVHLHAIRYPARCRLLSLQTFYVLSSRSSAMVTAMHSLQSHLHAHVANWFAQVRNSCLQHIAQSTGPSGHTVIMTSAIASVDSSIKCILTMLLPWRRPSARLPMTLTELHKMSLLTLLWTSAPKLSSEISLSSIRAHPCTWNNQSSRDSTKTERRKTWKGASAPIMQRLHLLLLLPLPLLFLLSLRLLVASALLLLISCLGYVQHKLLSGPTFSM